MQRDSSVPEIFPSELRKEALEVGHDPWLTPGRSSGIHDTALAPWLDHPEVAPAVEQIRVLFIEDDPDSHERVRRALAGERPRFTLECVQVLSAGIERLSRGNVDVLLVDLSLPDSAHRETLEKLRELVHDLPVIVLTAGGDPDEGLALVRRGAQDYIPKGMQSLKGTLGRSLRFSVARWRADAALRASGRRYRELLERAADVIMQFRIDDHGLPIPQFVNRKFEQLTGYKRAELYAHPELAFELVHPEQRALARRLAAGQVTEGSRIRWLTRDGRVKWLDWQASALVRSFGPSVVQCFCRDVTAQVEAERELEKAREQLTRAQKVAAVGQLTAGVAHDFNNLLTVITHHAEFAQDCPTESESLREDIRQILAAGDQARSLTQQLLAFSRCEPSAIKPTDLNELVIRMERMLRRLLGDDIVLSSRLAVDLWATEVDDHAFQQVLLNLAVNARDAMPEGGTLTMETCNVAIGSGSGALHELDMVAGAYVKVSVVDTGVGMDEETRGRVFEPFFSTKPPGRGTGLGLSICHRLVRQANGYVGVQSSPGAGTTICIYLPRSDRLPRQEAEQVRVEQQGAGTERILLVENDAAVRVPMARALRERGYDVLTAADGHEALRVSQEAKPIIALLLTAVVMPGMSGCTLATRLGRANAGLRVLYTTGCSREIIERHGVAGSGATVLQKPFAPDVLALRVREVLDRPLS